MNLSMRLDSLRLDSLCLDAEGMECVTGKHGGVQSKSDRGNISLRNIF